jgi:hypothetical protein
MRIGGLFVTGNQGAVGRLSQNDYKNIERLNPSKRRRVGSVFGYLLNDSNLNTLVELSEVQFVEEAMPLLREANNVGGATNWNLVDKSGNQVLLENQ